MAIARVERGAAKEMKRVQENVSWLIRHAADDFHARQRSVLASLTNPEAMMRCGFLAFPPRVDMTNLEAGLAADDQFADVCGTMARG